MTRSRTLKDATLKTRQQKKTCGESEKKASIACHLKQCIVVTASEHSANPRSQPAASWNSSQLVWSKLFFQHSVATGPPSPISGGSQPAANMQPARTTTSWNRATVLFGAGPRVATGAPQAANPRCIPSHCLPDDIFWGVEEGTCQSPLGCRWVAPRPPHALIVSSA